jgi:hypothetical protein
MGPHIHLDTRQTRVAAFLPQPLHLKYLMNMKLWGISEAMWTLHRPQRFVPLSQYNPQFFGHSAHRPAATMTDLSQLPLSLLLPNV